MLPTYNEFSNNFPQVKKDLTKLLNQQSNLKLFLLFYLTISSPLTKTNKCTKKFFYNQNNNFNQYFD